MSLGLALSNEEELELRVALENFRNLPQGRPFSLDACLNQWRDFVNRVHIGYPLGVYDYTNELSKRDILQRFVETLSGGLQGKVVNEVKVIDDRFIDETEGSTFVLPGAENSSGKVAWWWHRIPRKLVGEL